MAFYVVLVIIAFVLYKHNGKCPCEVSGGEHLPMQDTENIV